MHRTLVMLAVVGGVCVGSTAWAESASAGGRPRGFSLEVDLAALAPVIAEELLVVPNAVNLSPRLTLGAQIRRFFVGARAQITYYGAKDSEADDFAPAVWSVQLGPSADGEIWTRGPASLFIGGTFAWLLFATDNEDYHAGGFSVDLHFGGRVYVMDQLSIGLSIGSDFSSVFTRYERTGEDYKTTNFGWTLYGALCFRFVAAR